LELVTDSKYERISDIVEDISDISRAIKLCMSIAEIEELEN
jgi:hypothetical protein